MVHNEQRSSLLKEALRYANRIHKMFSFESGEGKTLFRSIIKIEYQLSSKDYGMVQKRNKNGSYSSDFQFVNYKLTQEDKNKFEQWRKKLGDQLEQTVLDLLQAQIKQSTSWDEDSKCWICSWTGTEDNILNAKRCITSRSPNYFEAMALNAFKSEIIFNGEVWEVEFNSNSWG